MKRLFIASIISTCAVFGAYGQNAQRVIPLVGGSSVSSSNPLPVTGGTGSPYQFQSAGAGQYGVSITSVTTLTVPAGSLIAEICVQTAAANYTTTGTTPTTSTGTGGIPVASGGCFQLAGASVLTAFKIIGASGAVMSVEYFK
jgi:hypothetical protein